MSPSKRTSSERALWIAGTALLVGTIALLVAVALVAGDALRGDDETAETSAAPVADVAVGTSPAAPDPDAVPACRLVARSALLQPSGPLSAALESTAIEISALSPARPRSEDGISFAIRDTINLPCDGDGGVISLRGGLRLSRGPIGIDLRRLRVDVGGRAVRMFMAPSGSPGFEGIAWQQNAPRLMRSGARRTLRIPVELTDSGALAVNAALQDPQLFTAGDAFAVLEVRLDPAPSNGQDDTPGP